MSREDSRIRRTWKTKITEEGEDYYLSLLLYINRLMILDELGNKTAIYKGDKGMRLLYKSRLTIFDGEGNEVEITKDEEGLKLRRLGNVEWYEEKVEEVPEEKEEQGEKSSEEQGKSD